MSEAQHVSPPGGGGASVRFLSDLALVRTSYSSERALMAWIRTSVSLYTFGFTISKFLDYLKMKNVGIEFSSELQRLGIVLICLGIIALVPAGFEHLKRIKTMKRLGLPETLRFSLPLVTTIVLIALGIATLIGIVGVW